MTPPIGVFAQIRNAGGPITYHGTRVEVHSFGRWYPGVIIKLNRKTALVRYTTGTGKTRDKRFSEWDVRLPGGES